MLLSVLRMINSPRIVFFRYQIENEKWFSGPDGYRWLTKELDGLQYVDQVEAKHT